MRTALPTGGALLLAAAALLGGPRAARADEVLLSGPHPFVKENALSVQYLIASGIGQSWSGGGVGVGYAYKLNGPAWLELGMNVRKAACGFFSGTCGQFRGNDAELLAGASYRIRTSVPLVPYLRAAAGLVYLFPEGASNVVGLTARAGAGLRYYVFDWLGIGVEGAMSLGHGFFESDYAGGHTYALVDIAVGVEWQFR